MSNQLLTQSARISEADRRTYETDGFLVVRGVFSAVEMAILAMESDRLLERKDLIDTNNLRCRWQNHADTNECRFDAFDPVIDLSPVCESVARDPRLFEIVSELYGEPALLFKDKLILKPPGATGYALHQDYIGWDSFPKSFITAAIAIDPSGANNGGTELFRGYHRDGFLSPKDGNYHSLPEEKFDPARGVIPELESGDVVIFGGFTPHRSQPNRSSSWRRLLYLSYNAESDGGDLREAHYREFHEWLPAQYAKYGKFGTYLK